MTKVKKLFVVQMEYDEEESDMFTDVGVEAAMDNQLFEMKNSGLVNSYEDTVVYDIPEELQNKLVSIAEANCD